MKTTIVHDYLTQRGGAERVVLEMARAYSSDVVLTSVYDPERTYPQFSDMQVSTLPLNRVPLLRQDPRLALPFLSDSFSHHRITDADLVLVSSSGFAHQVTADAPKIVYCHNPPRWLHQTADYLKGSGPLVKLAIAMLRPHLTTLDRRGALSADGYIANSRNVANRIRRVYGIEAQVVHPPRGLEPFGPEEPVPGLDAGFLVTVGRARGYKRTDLLMSAVAGMPDQRLVVVGGRSDEPWPDNIVQLTNVSDAQLRWLYKNAAGLLACSWEDFGLTPVEAFGFGTPVGAIQEGGYLETCVDGLTGTWLDATTDDSLRASIRRLLSGTWDRAAIRRHGAQWSPAAFHRQLIGTVDDVLGHRSATKAA
ncbi:glycosyltransferase [Modestobacter versicolor]|uniref:GDP-Man:Man(1)GlcNAc(2)-PP-Dol alpha-1,3-mannosyltransferase n=1 Tax=Modestobacter versicolor TaxID=429133 RepID=A0A323VEC9_9ACTN|nr:glycosyltransferase [Modestobacter versicolor]MBB3676994.1 glycosyltransferase involved in cell wall biosynthesis [Modestobacter versicolor]PZA22961.1 glycosyltransferase family 4 protein [Modestobacter versicolor]